MIVSRHQHIMRHSNVIECIYSVTRVCQDRDDRLHPAADLWFRELEQIANIASSTMNRTDPCRESDLLALSGSAFVDIRNMIRAVSLVKIDDLCHS